MAFFYAVNRSPTGPSPAPTPVEVAVEIVGCFSEDTTVTVLGQGLVAMKNLRVGDQILTGQKNPQYESIYAFGHYQPTQAGDFLVIHTDGGPKVEVTGEHLVYLDDKAYPVRASSVRIGDKLMTPDGAIAVAKISTTTKRGLYAPLHLTERCWSMVEFRRRPMLPFCKISIMSILSSATEVSFFPCMGGSICS